MNFKVHRHNELTFMYYISLFEAIANLNVFNFILFDVMLYDF